MRVVLVTGKGGVGKTSVAAASALRAAASGLRTLVVSTDPAHSLADALDRPLSSRPEVVEPGLEAQQVDARGRLEENWREIRQYLVSLMTWGGVGEVEAEELAVLPGLEEIFSLMDLLEHVEAGRHDLIVVDCAPTGETLRLLSLPDVLGWYIQRVFPVQRRLTNAVRPLVGRMTTMPLPQEALHGAVERFYRNLEAVRSTLTDGGVTTVRLVVNPERMVIAETRRTATYLSLFGYHLDAVVVNRLLPDDVEDPYFDRWKKIQAEHLAAVEEGFGDVPILRAPLFDEEVVGTAGLLRLGDTVYERHRVADILHHGSTMDLGRDAVDGCWVLTLQLPFAAKGDVDLFSRGGELFVKVGSYTRSIVLPAVLQRSPVGGASLEDGRLAVRFEPVECEPTPAPPRAPD